MKLISALVVSAVVVTIQSYECNHPNTPGLFPNKYTTVGYSALNLILEDTNPSRGNRFALSSDDLEFDVNIFSYQGQDMTIFDVGAIGFDVSDFSLTADRFNFPDTPYISPIWPPSGLDAYKFTVEYINRSAEFDETGRARGANICILERAEEMVNGCYRDDARSYDDVELEEVILVTWEFESSIDGYTVNVQALIANDGTGETFVLFVYDDIPSDFAPVQMPHINGNYSAAGPVEYAAVCDNQNITTLKDNSNCRCGIISTGAYIFATRDNSADVSEDYEKNVCDKDQATFTGLCTNDVRCKLLKTTDSNNVELAFKLYDTWGSFIFVDVASYTPEDPVLQTDGQCRGELTDAGNNSTVYTTEIDPLSPICGMTYSGGKLEFIIMTYNSTHEDTFNIVYDKTKFFKGSCYPSDLPFEIEKQVTLGGVLGSTVGPNIKRPMSLVLLKSRVWDPADATDLVFGSEIAYRRHAYLAIVYDYGTRNPRDSVEVYAAYPKDCWVSNNIDFQDSGNLKTAQILKNGCQHGSSVDPFYLEDEFNGIFLDDSQPAGEYNFISAAGAMRVVWWFNSMRKIYLKCSIGVCLNQDYFDNSKCNRSCSNQYENFDESRVKRSEDDTVTLTTSITIVDPPANDELLVSEEAECGITNTVAITTLVALIVLLLLSMVITLLLFIKLQRRQKK